MSDSEITTYGFGALVTLIVLRDLVPLIIKVIFPARAEAARLKAEREDAISQQERDHRRNLETRQIAAIEEIAKSSDANRLLMESFKVLIEQMEERITNLERLTYRTLKGIQILLDREGHHPDELDTPLSDEKTIPTPNRQDPQDRPDRPNLNPPTRPRHRPR